MEKYDVIIVGAGPAGLAAAISSTEQGAHTLLLERENHLGGILYQCIHPGFGLRDYGEELTGPEYAHRLISRARELKLNFRTGTTVLQVNASEQLRLQVAGKEGMDFLQANSVVLSMGCRERTRGNIAIPGSRPAGIFTAGTAQRWINIEGYHVGRRVIILGSGDIGMIMARRLTLEGAEVRAVIELMDYETGLKRNVVQCLEDFGIPLLLSHTVTEIHGHDRIEGVTICDVDMNGTPQAEAGKFWDCDCLLLSVGLIPENELTSEAGISIDPVTGGPYVDQNYMTGLPGVFACGNVLHVNDLVDNVAREGYKAGENAALYTPEQGTKAYLKLNAGGNIRQLVPQRLRLPFKDDPLISFRVKKPLGSARVKVETREKVIYQYGISHRILPGELQTFRLPAKSYSAGGPLVIEAEERGAK